MREDRAHVTLLLVGKRRTSLRALQFASMPGSFPQGDMANSTDTGDRLPGLGDLGLCCFISLCFDVLICKMGMMTLSLLQACYRTKGANSCKARKPRYKMFVK